MKRKENNPIIETPKKIKEDFGDVQSDLKNYLPWGVFDLIFSKIECRSWLSFSLVCKKMKESADRGINKLKECHRLIVNDLGIDEKDYPLVPRILRKKNLEQLLLLKRNVDTLSPDQFEWGEKFLGTIYCKDALRLTSKVSAILYQGEFVFKYKQFMSSGKGRMLYSSGDFYEGYLVDFHINGEGRYYKEGILYYEGRFLHYTFHGYGRLYYPNGNLKYKGQFLNGIYHGKGKSYYNSGTLEYKGFFKNGEQHGSGEKYNQNGVLVYKGEYYYGKRHGKGEEYDEETGVLLYKIERRGDSLKITVER